VALTTRTKKESPHDHATRSRRSELATGREAGDYRACRNEGAAASDRHGDRLRPPFGPGRRARRSRRGPGGRLRRQQRARVREHRPGRSSW
jgi:hypothetical protein